MTPLVLASTSPFRRELLARLGLPFECRSPDYPEGDIPGLSPDGLAKAHALGKARSVFSPLDKLIVIGSDQVADLDGVVLGKPHTADAAVDQLRRMAGRWVVFHTGLAVLASGHPEQVWVETYRVRLRALEEGEIQDYVRLEQPLGCAGSFRIEGLGIALMDEMAGRDYTALIGLPLIALTRLLRAVGVRVPVTNSGGSASGC